MDSKLMKECIAREAYGQSYHNLVEGLPRKTTIDAIIERYERELCMYTCLDGELKGQLISAAGQGRVWIGKMKEVSDRVLPDGSDTVPSNERTVVYYLHHESRTATHIPNTPEDIIKAFRSSANR